MFRLIHQPSSLGSSTEEFGVLHLLLWLGWLQAETKHLQIKLCIQHILLYRCCDSLLVAFPSVCSKVFWRERFKPKATMLSSIYWPLSLCAWEQLIALTEETSGKSLHGFSRRWQLFTAHIGTLCLTGDCFTNHLKVGWERSFLFLTKPSTTLQWWELRKMKETVKNTSFVFSFLIFFLSSLLWRS